MARDHADVTPEFRRYGRNNLLTCKTITLHCFLVSAVDVTVVSWFQARNTSLENIVETQISVYPKHHRHFLIRRGDVLRMIGDEYGGVAVSFPRISTNSDKVTIKGAADYVEGAQARILEIVADLEAQVSIKCVIEQKYHRTVMGSKVQQITSDYNVKIKVRIFANLYYNYKVKIFYCKSCNQADFLHLMCAILYLICCSFPQFPDRPQQNQDAPAQDGDTPATKGDHSFENGEVNGDAPASWTSS